MFTRILWLPAALAGALLTASACGGSPPPGPTPTPAPIVQPPVDTPPPPTPPAPAPVLTVTRVLAFGDSMTEGVDSPPLLVAADWTLPLTAGRSQSYPFKLKALLNARYTGQSIEVFNGGWAGRQAREDRSRFSDAMSAGRPDLILLMEGSNDLNQSLQAGEGINARVTVVVNALEDFVRDAGFRNVPVLIATLPPQRPGAPKAWGVELLPRFNDAVRQMAARKNVPVVDVAALPLSTIGQDGLHPTESGYGEIATLFFDAIRSRYEKALD